METKFNFKSQTCTDRNQSERLLALGLKKETADMCWVNLAIFDFEEDLAEDFFLVSETTFSALLVSFFLAIVFPPYAIRFRMKINSAMPQQ